MKKLMSNGRALKILIIVSTLALLVSSYLLYMHYSREEVKWCIIGEAFDCDAVNKGAYSTIDGSLNHILGTYFYIPIPNALLSMLVFLFIIIGSTFIYKNKLLFGISPKILFKTIKVLLILGLIYALFLIYIEAYVLMAWCIFCLVLDVLIITALISVLLILKHKE